MVDPVAIEPALDQQVGMLPGPGREQLGEVLRRIQRDHFLAEDELPLPGRFDHKRIAQTLASAAQLAQIGDREIISDRYVLLPAQLGHSGLGDTPGDHVRIRRHHDHGFGQSRAIARKQSCGPVGHRHDDVETVFLAIFRDGPDAQGFIGEVWNGQTTSNAVRALEIVRIPVMAGPDLMPLAMQRTRQGKGWTMIPD